MQLHKFELEVLQIMINDRLTSQKWNEFLSTYSIIGFEYTGSGYYLKIRSEDIGLKNEVIDRPTILGKTTDWEVGFILYVDDGFITLECHSWCFENPPENMREYEYQLEIINLNMGNKKNVI